MLESKSLLPIYFLLWNMKRTINNASLFSVTQRQKLLLLIDSRKLVINLGEENVSQEFRLKNREINYYFIEEVEQI